MKAETLDPQHPLTPPDVNNELYFDLHQVAQYVSDCTYSIDEPHHPSSAYGSPASMGHEGIPGHSTQPFHFSYAENHPGTDFGLSIQYDEYRHSGAYYQEGQYDGMPTDQPLFSGSPRTPRSVTEDDDPTRRAQSRRSIVASSPSQGETRPKPKLKASPKPRKVKAGKSEKPKTPKLTAPLSILTRDFAFIPVRDMKEWVERSAEVRMKEVEKRNGYVTRPMNSFMLYRSAYAERTKQWCLQNNHQIVSLVSGESWPLEPPEVRERYNDYAKIERMNHQNAHPTYKFSPSKTAALPRKRKGDFSDDDIASDVDGEWLPGHGRSRMRHSGNLVSSLDGSFSCVPNHIHPDFYHDRFGPNGNGMSSLTWDMINEGRPMPMSRTQGDLYNQYFQTTVHPNLGMSPAMMEDMRMHRTDTREPSMHFSHAHSLLGLPGDDVAGLMYQLHPQSGTPLDEPRVDPMLLTFDGHHYDSDHSILAHQPDFRVGHTDRDLDQDSVDSFVGTASSHEEFHPDTWQSDPNMAQIEQGSEFEKWMDDRHASEPCATSVLV